MSSIVIIPLADPYPASAGDTQYDRRTTVQVRQRVPLGAEPRPVMRQKIRLLKNLGFQHLVGLETSSEDEHSLSLLF